jgi:hypothetical protein
MDQWVGDTEQGILGTSPRRFSNVGVILETFPHNTRVLVPEQGNAGTHNDYACRLDKKQSRKMGFID